MRLCCFMFMISQFHTSLSYLQAYTKAVRPVLFIITHTDSVIIHCRKKYHNIWVSWFYNISLFPNVRNCHILSSTIWLYHLFTHGSTSHIVSAFLKAYSLCFSESFICAWCNPGAWIATNGRHGLSVAENIFIYWNVS